MDEAHDDGLLQQILEDKRSSELIQRGGKSTIYGVGA